MVDAYPSKLAKYLHSVLKSLIPNHCISKDSFDIVSLFTNIPVRETIHYILNIISENNLPLPKSVMKELLHVACSNTLLFLE